MQQQKTKNRYYPDNITVSYDKFFRIRAELGLTENQIAIAAGITPSILSRWRRGLATPSIRTLHKVAKVCECSANDFLVSLSDAI